jgi:hypothetical protein
MPEQAKKYCRKCTKTLPLADFYQAVDGGYLDTDGYLSVCKECCKALYDSEFEKTQSVEKAMHRVCIALNIRYSEDALEATKRHINAMIDNGMTPPHVFGTYKSKLIAVLSEGLNKESIPMMYEDVSTVYVTPPVENKELYIPEELQRFWGDNYSPKEIEYLEREFTDAKATHRADSWAEITLLKEVCYKLLEIKKDREADPPNSTAEGVKELQVLMKSLSISPSASGTGSTSRGSEILGKWIEDIEREEPAQWLQKDGKKYSIYRDVEDQLAYYNQYFVRPLKNFITLSKDFSSIEEENIEDEDFTGVDDTGDE